MAELSTTSTTKDFEDHLDGLVYGMSSMTGKLTQMHHSTYTNGNGHSRYNRFDVPDKTSFEVGFSVAISSLSTVVNVIREAEDVVETMLDEDGIEPEELLVAQGELYASKSMYISLAKMYGPLETARLRSTAYGMPSGEFMKIVGNNKAIPRFGSDFVQGLPKIDFWTNSNPQYSYQISSNPIYKPF